MIYSVWNQGAGDFEYFEDAKVQHELNVEKPAHLQSRALGSTVGQAAWPMPASARPIGRGQAPVGRVASLGGDAMSGSDESLTTKAVLLLVAGVLLWRYVVPRTRRAR